MSRAITAKQVQIYPVMELPKILEILTYSIHL